MSIHLFMGQEFEHTHEMKALRQFLGDMQTQYGASDQYYFVFVNCYVGGCQIDLTVLKENAITVIELKECGGDPIRGAENGDWVICHYDSTGTVINPGRKNPFEQAREYRFAWINFLEEKKSHFLPPQKASQMDFYHVSAFVALSPRLHPSSQVDITSKPWFRVVGLDRLCQAVYDQRSPKLSFTEKELTTLAEDVLQLKRVEVEEFLQIRPPVASLARMSQETSVSAEQWRIYCQSLVDNHAEWTELFVPLEALEFVPTRLIPLEGTRPFPSMPHLRKVMPTPQAMPVVVLDYVRRCESPLVILGDPGLGKTAAVELLAVEYACRRLGGEAEFIPVLVKLNKYDQQHKRGLRDLIAMSLRARGLQVSIQQVEEFLASTATPLLLIFDGLDEVKAADRVSVKQDLESLLRCYPTHKYIITCRKADYDDFALRIEREQRAELSPFDEKGIRRFLIEYYWAYEQDSGKGRVVFEQLKRQGLLDFARIPLHLGLIVGIAGEAGELPANRGKLYQRFVDETLRLEKVKGTVSQEWTQHIGRFLAHLALVMQEKDALRIGESEARKEIGQYWQDLWDANKCSLPRDQVFNGTLNSRLLVRIGGELGFRHSVFQDYFVARRLAYMIEDSERDIYHYIGVPGWDTAFELLAGLMDDASGLLNAIPDGADPVFVWHCLVKARNVDDWTKERTLECILDRLSDPDYLGQLIRDLDRFNVGLLNAPDDLIDYLSDNWTERILSSDIPLDMLLPYIRFAKQGNASLVEQKLLAALNDFGHESERLRAAELLAYLGNEESVEPLIACLGDENHDLRIKVIETLGKIGGTGAIKPLKACLFDNDSDVRRAAIAALGSLCGADASPPPQSILAAFRVGVPDQEPDRKEVEAVKELLRSTLLDPSAEVRTEAAVVLGCLGEAQAADQLIRLLKDNEFDYFEKGRLVRALGYIGTEEAVEAIKEFSDAGIQINPELGIIAHEDLGNPIGFECTAAFFLRGNTSGIEWLWFALLEFVIYRIGMGTGTVDSEQAMRTHLYRLNRWQWYQEKLVPTIAAMGPKAVIPLLECIHESGATALDPELIEKEAGNLLERVIIRANNVETLASVLTGASQISEEVEGAIWLLGRYILNGIFATELEARLDVFNIKALIKTLKDRSELIDLLIEVAQESEWADVREAAALILAQFVRAVGKDAPVAAKAYDRVLELVEELDSNLLIRAILGEPQLVPLLVELLDEKDESRRRAAAYLLLKFYTDERGADTGTEGFHDADMMMGKALAVLADDLRSPEPPIRQLAAGVLHDRGDKSVVEALIWALDDKDFSVRLDAIKALGRIGGRRAVGALTDILYYHEDGYTRKWAADALGNIGDPAAASALVRALLDENASVRAQAADALGKLGDASVVPSLVEALCDPAPEVQRAVVHALGKVGQLETVKPLLREIPEAESSNVQYWVAITLVWLKDSTSVDLCVQALDCGDTGMRQEALEALASAGTDLLDANRLLEICANMLEDEDWEVRSRAVQGLGKVSSPQSISLLQEISK